MKKDLNKKLRIDSINWVEVFSSLPKNQFTEFDIKRALKKTGRDFNLNGPFRSLVREFISKLGKNVEVTVDKNEKKFLIKDRDSALKCLGWVRREETRREIEIKKKSLTDLLEIQDCCPKETKKDNEIEKCSASRIKEAIILSAIFSKADKKELPVSFIKKEVTEKFNYNWNTFRKEGFTKKSIIAILDKVGVEYIPVWGKHQISGKVLDGYEKLKSVYEKITGAKFNCDNYILGDGEPEKPQQKDAPKIEVKVETSEDTLIKMREDTSDIKWTKYLIIQSLLFRNGGATKLSNLLDWIKTTRNESISLGLARELILEMNYDSERQIFKFYPGDMVSLNLQFKDQLISYYNPEKIEEIIYVKLFTDEDKTRELFPNLNVALEETTVGGEFIYKVTANYSYKAEIDLKSLLGLVEIKGKLYSQGEPLLTRIQGIKMKEELEIKKSRELLLSLEK